MLDLFSGIGGFSLAASWIWKDELEIVGFCETDKYCQKVLNKHWPDVPIYNNIKELDGTQFKSIGLIAGGFPCQPFSQAGKRKGAADDRALWPEMFRVIKEAKPCWIVGENVAGIINMELDTVLSDLESEGYETQAFIIPACSTDAPHRRDRVWIVANNADTRFESMCKRKNSILADTISNAERSAHRGTVGGSKQEREKQNQRKGCEVRNNPTNGSQDVSNAKRVYVQRCKGGSGEKQFGGSCGWLPEPAVGRVAHGIPNRVDRLKCLGNAIVPQVAARIFWAIKEVDKGG